MPDHDIFRLDRAGFNGFLFATVGAEADGSCLTVLSVLARLGHDPWATAADWAALPDAEAAWALAACIAQMPVRPDDIRAASRTAERLILLLSPPAVAPVGQRRPSWGRPLPGFALTLLSALACTAILAGGVFLAVNHQTAAQAGASEQVVSRTL